MLSEGVRRNLYSVTGKVIDLAVEHSWDIAKPDGHWHGEILANATITAEQIFLYQSLGLEIPDAGAYRCYLLSQQKSDGSWSIAPEHPGDVSTSAEAYLALKILGMPADHEAMCRGRAFIRQCGGVAKVRVFTRFFFAQFGLFPWDAVPQLPAEFILFPAAMPVSIYSLASWARSTIIPLLIIRHHEEIYALPNGTDKNNTFLDELWLDPGNKRVHYGPSLLQPWKSDPWSLFFSVVDTAMFSVNRFRHLWPLRVYARKRCVQWILEHQEVQGDWGGIIPPMHAGVQALLLEGYKLEDDCIRKAMEAIERFTWHDKKGKRLQSCMSPVWDTVLMTRSLCDVGVDRGDHRIRRSIKWIKEKQLLGPEGDWRILRPGLSPGGFSFEYYNTWYPDTDDTAAAILALIHHDPAAIDSATVVSAASWLCGMQNTDGGWGAFDVANDKLWLNQIPFSDMDALCDPSSADVTGRILEAFGRMLELAGGDEYLNLRTRDAIAAAATRGVAYLLRTQDPRGCWYGRWGVNYLYGTSNVVCGLAALAAAGDDGPAVRAALTAAAVWLRGVQRADGGWGEAVSSYRDAADAGQGAPATPSQTAWALMALLAATEDPWDPAVEAGVAHLTRTQAGVLGDGAVWPEVRYTGTGFPNFFYLGYALYSHYFPLMALGRYRRAVEAAMDRGTAGETSPCSTFSTLSLDAEAADRRDEKCDATGQLDCAQD